MNEADDKELEMLMKSASPWSTAGLVLPPTALMED